MVLYGPVWSHMVMYGPVWSRIVLFGPIGSRMILYSCSRVWPCMAAIVLSLGQVTFYMNGIDGVDKITRGDKSPIFFFPALIL